MVRKTEVSLIEEPPSAAEVRQELVRQQVAAAQATEEFEEDFSLSNVLAELGSGADDAKINVFLLESGKPSAFVDSFSPSEFSLETLKQIYGPGTYKIQIRANGRIIPGGKNVRIAKSLVPVGPTIPQFAPDKLIETMQAGFSQMATMFTQALDRMAASQPKAKTTMETLQELQIMREIFGVNSAPQTNPVDVINVALELAGKINPGPSDENTVLMEGIKQFGPLLTQLVGSGPQAPAGMNGSRVAPTVPALPPRPVPIPTHPAPVQVHAPAESQAPQQSASISVNPQDQQNMMINLYLQTLLANARADNDTMTYAEVILDYMGDDEATKLANNPDWFSMLCQRVPEAANYPGWFEELRQNILVLTKPENSGIQENNDNNAASVDVPERSNIIGGNEGAA